MTAETTPDPLSGTGLSWVRIREAIGAGDYTFAQRLLGLRLRIAKTKARRGELSAAEYEQERGTYFEVLDSACADEWMREEPNRRRTCQALREFGELPPEQYKGNFTIDDARRMLTEEVRADRELAYAELAGGDPEKKAKIDRIVEEEIANLGDLYAPEYDSPSHENQG